MPIVERGALPELQRWFEPERPGPIVFPHVMSSGQGRVIVDRWPDPQVVCAELPGNLALRGDPAAPGARAVVDQLTGFVEASPEWLPVLRASAPDAAVWDRVVAILPAEAAVGAAVRAVRLGPGDVAAIDALPDDIAWISSTWGGPAGMAKAEVAHGAFVDGVLAAVAVPFFIGRHHEDIGVVTHADHRRKGLSAECTRAVVADILARGHVPTWTTSPDNAGSLAVADRIGFVPERTDVLYAVRTPIPV